MASTHKHIRSSTANKRPTTAIADGQIALNTNASSPGLFFKDSTGASIIKIGPVHVGSSAPNATPGAGGSSGNSTGEIWLDNSLTPVGVKIWNGSAWVNATPVGSTTVQGLLELATDAETQTGSDTARAVTPAGLQSKLSDSTSTTSSITIASSTAVKSAYDLANAALPKSGGTITGNLEIGTTGSLSFEGSTADAFETTIAVTNPTADRTITLPDTTGTVVTTGDTGTVTSTMILDGTIVDADISASAEIAVSKLADGAARQLLQTDAAGTGVEWASNIDIPGTLDVTSAATFDSSVAVTGALTKSGNNVVTVGDTGTVTSTMILDGTILNADVNASAAIAGTKISPDFGSQNTTTTGTSTAASFIPTSSTVPTNGVYLPATNSVAISTGGSGRLFVDASGNIGFGQAYGLKKLTIAGEDPGANGAYATGQGSIVLNEQTRSNIATEAGGIEFKGSTFGAGYGTKILGLNAGGIAIGTRENSATWSERLRITSAGLVGIGTSSPLATLDVVGNSLSTTYFWNRIGSGEATATRGLLFTIDGTDYGRIYSPNGKSVAIQAGAGTLTDALTVDQSGRVGIGTTSPSVTLDVNGSSNVTATSLAQYFGINAIGTGSGVGNGIFAPAGNTLGFSTGASERARIDSSGRLLVGTSTSRSNFFNTTAPAQFQIEGTGVDSFASQIRNSANPNCAVYILAKSRGAAVGSNTVVVSADQLGQISFQGSDGTDFVEAANIIAEVDGTPGANDMPGRIVLSTTSDGASSPTERARITSGGYFKASNSGTYLSSTSTEHEVCQNSQSNSTLIARASNASYQATVYYAYVDRAANTAYNFFIGNSGAGADNEFILRGDGNAFADGTWTGGGADYAEYFEWADSNTDEEDRRGISVVLDGDKIREAQAGEDPIGVISGNPSVVGDAAWNKWSGKYLRDEYGTYLLDANGDRQINPSYDPDAEYIPREQRPEWDCVGLMGKLRIRKGQVTGSRWIKMRDINDSVEEWLVR